MRGRLVRGDVFYNLRIQLCDLPFDQGQLRRGLALQNSVGLDMAAVMQAPQFPDQGCQETEMPQAMTWQFARADEDCDAGQFRQGAAIRI